MDIKFYCNSAFDTYQTRKSGVTYVKVSAVINYPNGPMFSVLCIKETLKAQIQCFKDASAEHLWGLTNKSHYTYEKFCNSALNNLDAEYLKAFYECTRHLDRSFKNCAMKNSLDSPTQADVYNELRKFRRDFQEKLTNAMNGVKNAPAKPGQTVADIEESDWKDINNIITDLPVDTLNTVVNKLNDSENHNFVVKDGFAYRIVRNGNEAKLQVAEIGNVAEKAVPVAKKPEDKRNTKMVAFVKDNSYLEDVFESGMFYDIVKSDNGYVTLLGADGIEHVLNSKRLEFVKVFTEAPKEEVTA